MTYLLDTPTLIWYLRTPAGLPMQVRRLIDSPTTMIAISLATPWEIALKTSAGRLDAADIVKDFDSILIRGRYNLLTPTLAHVVRSGNLPWFHRDPFDRLIAAQALELGWSLLSKDVIFDAYGVRRIWN
ncbi:MAG TPA: type II toxin-antitoxin system VapC family toxin [Terracidiphilus sp.]|jgi:PIN domain nuclease of toxin-antitoxin system|nr:type II toxin-antitoxin system VapC family toxin [Terracidiphilus sp.]